MLVSSHIAVIRKVKYQRNVEDTKFSQAVISAERVKKSATQLSHSSSYENLDIGLIANSPLDGSFGKSHATEKSPGDDHCFLHSVVYGMQHMLFQQNVYDLG